MAELALDLILSNHCRAWLALVFFRSKIKDADSREPE